MSWFSFVSLLALVSLAVPSTPGQSRKQPLPESFTATAQFIGAAGSVAATLKIRVERYTPDAEREAVVQALKQGGYPGFVLALRKAPVVQALKQGGYPGFVLALRKAPVVGSVNIGEHAFDIRWARETPIKNGRSIVVVTDKPLFFLGAGSPTAKPKEGFDVAVVSFKVDDVGMGYDGKMAAAARVKTGENGVEVSEYAEKLIDLRSVTRDIK